MHRKTFSLATLKLSFESERIIEDSEGFPAFLTDGEGDLIIRVYEGSIPEPSGIIMFRRRNHICYADGECTMYYSFYYDTASEKDKIYACFVRGKNTADLYIDYPPGLWDSMIFDAINITSLLLEKDTLMLHSSCVEYNGEAILFTAPKQTGKSTQAMLWEKNMGALIVNGDRMAIGFENGRLTAYGTPYRGSSKIGLNKILPVRAIVSLSQAKENKIEEIKGASAFIAVLDGLSVNMEIPQTAQKVSELVAEITNKTDIYSLACLPDESAVRILYNEIY